jgi:hypothetical protein
MISLLSLLIGVVDARHHQPCYSAVSGTKIIPDLDLAEGRNFATGSKPTTQPFSSTKLTGFTDKRKLFINVFWCGGTPPAPPILFLIYIFLTIQDAKDAETIFLLIFAETPKIKNPHSFGILL